jgi:hypothetical protein
MLSGEEKPPEDAFLPPGTEFVWEAFWRLHHDRSTEIRGFAFPMGGMILQSVPGRIPFSAVHGYAQRFGIIGEDFDLLIALIQPLDLEYLEWDREKREASASVD